MPEAPAGAAAAFQGWAGVHQSPSLGLSCLWDSRMLTLLCLGAGTKHSVEEAWGGDCPCFCGTDRGLHPPEGCDEPEHHSSSGKAGPCAGAGRVPLPWPSVWQLLIGMDSAAVAGAQLQGTDRGQP